MPVIIDRRHAVMMMVMVMIMVMIMTVAVVMIVVMMIVPTSLAVGMLVMAMFTMLVLMMMVVIVRMVVTMPGAAGFLPQRCAANKYKPCKRDATEQHRKDELVGQNVVIAEEPDLPRQEADARQQPADSNGADLIEEITLAVAVSVVIVSHDRTPFIRRPAIRAQDAV